MIINNSNNINKANNHLSPKLTEHKNTMTYDVRNPHPGLERVYICGRVKPVNGNPALPSVECSIYHLSLSFPILSVVQRIMDSDHAFGILKVVPYTSGKIWFARLIFLFFFGSVFE